MLQPMKLSTMGALVMGFLSGLSSPVLAINADAPIVIGLDAAMSGVDAQGGEAIRRGATIAIAEINAAGGVLDRPFKLMIRDHRANPARGIDNMDEFGATKDLVAVIGGVHTPVAMAELESIHRHQLFYLGPWAAGTPIVANGHSPNFVFRVSVRDEHAGGFLIEAAQNQGFKSPGLLLWRTAWGRSNEKAMTAALGNSDINLAGIEWFNSGERDMSQQIAALAAKGADVIILVANSADGRVAIRDIARMPASNRLPVISHWGITGGDFYERASADIKQVELTFLQTFSFFDSPFPDRTSHVYEAYCDLFGPCTSVADVRSPVGVAHAYDLVHMLGRAIENANSTDRVKIRAALENLPSHQGLMRDYNPPFTANRHDALDARDFRLSRFSTMGSIVPAETR